MKISKRFVTSPHLRRTLASDDAVLHDLIYPVKVCRNIRATETLEILSIDDYSSASRGYGHSSSIRADSITVQDTHNNLGQVALDISRVQS